MTTKTLDIHPLDVQPGDLVVTVTSDVQITIRREVPDIAVGTSGTATVQGKPKVRVMRVDPDDRTQNPMPWVSDHMIGGWFFHADGDVSDFVPDHAPRRLTVTKTVTRELLADALARHYGDHDDDHPADPSTSENYRADADAILALLGGAA